MGADALATAYHASSKAAFEGRCAWYRLRSYLHGSFYAARCKEAAVAGAAEKAAAVEQSTSDVKQAEAEEELTKTRNSAWQTYQAGTDKLSEALGGAVTGPFLGRIAALSENSRMAQAGSAIMLPILKSIFRESGEGTFTDADQRALLRMLPTVEDGPEVIRFKFEIMDELVRSKLGQPEAGSDDEELGSIEGY